MLLTYVISLFLGLTRASTGSVKQFYLQGPSNLAAPKQHGIGFDFSPSHGIASVSFANGTIVQVASIPGDGEYRALMERVSRSSYQHIAPPYHDKTNEWMTDYPRQKLRTLRKKLGYPASEDAGILGRLAVSLKYETEKILGHDINGFHVAASFPRYVALYDEEVLDAIEWAGLRYRQVTWGGSYGDTCFLRPASSAFASIGLGLCTDYKNTSACVHELFPKPPFRGLESILVITLSPNALLVEWFNMINAYRPLEMRNMYDFSLGSDQAASSPNYWEDVRSALRAHFTRYEWDWHLNAPRKAFLAGSSGDRPEFLDVVSEVLAWKGDEVPLYAEDVDFQLAKGTAELAKRAEYLNWRNIYWHEEDAEYREDIDPNCWASGDDGGFR